jgi:hypothetical protein
LLGQAAIRWERICRLPRRHAAGEARRPPPSSRRSHHVRPVQLPASGAARAGKEESMRSRHSEAKDRSRWLETVTPPYFPSHPDPLLQFLLPATAAASRARRKQDQFRCGSLLFHVKIRAIITHICTSPIFIPRKDTSLALVMCICAAANNTSSNSGDSAEFNHDIWNRIHVLCVHPKLGHTPKHVVVPAAN